MAKKFLPESRYTRLTRLEDPKNVPLGQIVHVKPWQFVPAVGLLVYGHNFDGLIPIGDISIYPDDDDEKISRILIRKDYLITAKVIESPGLLILSRKSSMEDALKEIHPEKILSAKITNFHSETTFLDIGAGIGAILPISEVSLVHIEPDELRYRFRGIDSIHVKVLHESSRQANKFIVSYRGAFKPLELSVGDIVRGKVHSDLPDGSGKIVEISPAQAGIVDVGPSNPWIKLNNGKFYSFRVTRIRPKSNDYFYYSLELIS